MAAAQKIDAEWPAIKAGDFGFTASVGTALDNTATDPRDKKELITGATTGMSRFSIDNQPENDFQAESAAVVDGAPPIVNPGSQVIRTARNRGDVTRINDGEGIGADWFERVHIFPKVSALGNVVSDQSIPIDLYSSYRRTFISLIDIDNQVSTQGVTISGAPSLPKNHAPQRSLGLSLEISQIGPPDIDGDIIFDYDIRDITLSITGTRVILFTYPPQRNVAETLSWKTNVMKSADGTEMRAALRRYPRQVVEYEIIPRRPQDLSFIRSLLVEWQPRVFGVPLWWWARKVTADVAALDTSVTAADLSNMDLRVGGLVMLAKRDPDDIDAIIASVLEVESFGSPENTITFTSDITEAYEVVNGAFICPVVPCVVDKSVDLVRSSAGLAEYKMRFTSTDNVTDLADTSSFTTYQGKVVMDMHNIMSRSYTQKLTHKNTRIDYDIGRIDAFSSQLVGVSTHPLRMQNDSNLTEWERRGLLYALRGQQVSFFLPTNQPDVEIIADAASGSASIDVKYVGFSAFIQQRAPIQDIQITLNDGTVARHRVTGSVEITDGERLSITPTLAQDVDVADTKEICYLLQQRLADDSAKVLHKWVNEDGDIVDSEISLQTVGVPNG